MMVSKERKGDRWTNLTRRLLRGVKNELRIRFSYEDIGELSPDNYLKLSWISPIRDSVRVDCKYHINIAHEFAIKEMHTRVGDQSLMESIEDDDSSDLDIIRNHERYKL